MSKFFRLCRANNNKHGLRDQALNFSFSSLNLTTKPQHLCRYGSIFLLLLILITAGFYVYLITSSATNGFRISEQQVKLNELKIINQELTAQFNNLDNLANIKAKAGEMGLVAADKIEYLEMDDKGVAVNK